MKVSVDSYVMIERFGDFAAAELIKEIGFDALDYSYYWENEREEVLGDNYIDHAKKLREHLDKIGLECNQAHAPFSVKYGSNFDLSDKNYLWLVHSIESASILGAENIVVHSITVPDDVDFEEYNIRYYKSLVPYCEKFKIHVAVENLFRHDTSINKIFGKIGTPEELNKMVESIGSPWIVACVDVGHASLTGYKPEEFIEGVSPKILKSLHVQDTDYVLDRHALPYTQEFNWDAIMGSLKKIGYDGDLTFEVWRFLYGFPKELLPDALKLVFAVGKHLVNL